MSLYLWAEARTWREVFLLQKSKQNSLCPWRVQTHSDVCVCVCVCVFNQSSLVTVLGDSVLPTSGPKENWATPFLYIRISHSVWEIEDSWNTGETQVFSARWTKEWLISHTDRIHLVLKITTHNISLSGGTWRLKANLHLTLLFSPVRKLSYVFKVTLPLFCNWK